MVIPLDIEGDGSTHSYRIDLAGKAGYRGGMTQVRIQLPTGPGRAKVYAVELQ